MKMFNFLNGSIFNLLGDFVCAYKIDSCFGDKEHKKALKKVLKGIK